MKETVQVAVCLLDTVPVNSINEKKKGNSEAPLLYLSIYRRTRKDKEIKWGY
jgi:hypothetical protein